MATNSSKKTASGKSAASKPKAKAKPKASTGKAGTRGADRADKSVEEFRDALERSVTLSRERIQEVVDDTVKRGRMTRDDAHELVSKLVSRGRKQTEDLLKELEAALEAARKEVERRTKTARKEAGKQVRQARKKAIGAADEPLAQTDKLRAMAGAPGFPITAYDELTAPQVKRRVGDLTKADARKVRTYETANKARSSVLAEIDARLAK